MVLFNDPSSHKCSATQQHVLTVGSNQYGQLGIDSKDPQCDKLTEINTLQPNHIIKFVSCGDKHTYLVTEENKLYATGSNYFGQLAEGQVTKRERFKRVRCEALRERKIRSIDSGTNFTIVLTDDNKLFSCGSNSYGQCSFGCASSQQCAFKEITEPKIESDIVQISCGGLHTMVLTAEHKVYTCGWNGYGQLCHGDNRDRHTLELIDFDKEVIAVEGSSFHSLVLTKDGEVYACGKNNNGECGLGHTRGVNSLQRVCLPADVHVSRIFTGSDHSIFLTEDNELYTCGWNIYGQLGIGEKIMECTPTRIQPFTDELIKDVSCKHSQHTIVVTETDRVFTCGRNDWFQLCQGHRNNLRTFEEVEYKDATSPEQHVSIACASRTHSILIVQPSFDLTSKIERLHAKVPLQDVSFFFACSL
jgi:alpha-tubulin suppressor-like RCC1 family protein